MDPKPAGPSTGLLLAATALSLSVGWGIRGNFGHEYGAMIPGALASIAGVIMAGRSDWLQRVAAFGFFGAIGWAFGGSISYMQVIGYTHSGDSLSVFYGFACLFIIGFLWAAMGGAGLALPACLDRKTLEGFVPPLAAVFLAWFLQDVVTARFEPADAQFRQASWLYWYDTDWLAALVAGVVTLGFVAVRRRWDPAASLMLHMVLGWWAAFLVLVVVLGWRMTPPRGDNWAGCAGMVAGMWIFFRRRGWNHVLVASLISGFVGGFGFATATLLKLIEVRSGLETNWHSVLEQTYGLINGLGVGLAVLFLARNAPRLTEPQLSRWAQLSCVGFVLLVIPYVNLVKNPEVWVKAKTVPQQLYGLSAETWFNLAFLALGAAVLVLLWRHGRRRIALVPASPLGKAQLLFVAFLWCMVIGNLERALVGFAPQRLITEGVIHLNALLCTVLALAGTFKPEDHHLPPALRGPPRVRSLAAVGLAAAVFSVAADWAIVRAVYGDQFAGHASLHIRFGPRATAHTSKPKPDQPHP
jgi:hypothetical protein